MTDQPYGVRLTAQFFRACGREVEFRLGGTERVPFSGGRRLCWQTAGDGEECLWVPINDYASGHLEEIIGMVRERWPDAHIRLECDPNGGGTWKIWWCWITVLSPVVFEAHGRDDNSASVSVMLAAIRAAGLEVPEP